MINNKPLSICVFCGSSPGARPEYQQIAEELGRGVAERGWRLVYGGTHVGLMGRMADSALRAGGAVVGIIPRQLQEMELAHQGLTELQRVPTLHERKARMADLSDAIVALPGGYGTLDELFEIVTWRQLKLHDKPIVLINVAGYYNSLLQFLDRCVVEGFLQPHNRSLIRSVDSVEAALKGLEG